MPKAVTFTNQFGVDIEVDRRNSLQKRFQATKEIHSPYKLFKKFFIRIIWKPSNEKMLFNFMYSTVEKTS